MTVRVVIDNPSDDLLDALQFVVKLDPGATMAMEYPDEEELPPEVMSELYAELDKAEEQRRNGTARYYRDMEEYKAAHSEIQDTDDYELRKVS